jgi:cardiolipin synthase A/B
MNLQFVLEILALLVPILHGVGIVCAVHAILFGRTSQGAIAWALSLIFFPYVAIILYLVFGRQKFHGYIEARRLGDREIDHLADTLANSLQPYALGWQGDSDRLHALQHLSLFPFTRGNSARLLVDGKATFDAILAAIDHAHSHLLVQFFIIRDDELGRELRARLVAKARQGVKVCLLFDEIGCIRLPRHFFAPLRQTGGRIHPFNSRRGWRNRLQINFRNHRKIVIADGHTAFVGGHNVGTEYLGQSPRFGRWRDTHVELRGPAVAAVHWSFVEDWYWATGEILSFTPAPPPASEPKTAGLASDLPQSSSAELLEPSLDHPLCPCAALAIPTGPADDFAICTLMFLAAISAAKTRLWITSPYFVPDETIFDALQLAALRGVDVKIMLPAKPDHILVYLSSFSYLQSAENVGVKCYRYQGGFLHQKVMLIDDDLAAIGTANLDNRSMRLNFELTVFFTDRPFVSQVAHMLEEDFRHCRRATAGDLGRRGLPFRIAVRIARLLSPIQ